MSDTLTFRIPWEHLVSDNRKFISRKFILTAQYREAKRAIALYATAAAKKAKWKRAEHRLKLEVAVTEPDHRMRDLNFSKAVKDGINESEAVWWDDCQVRWELWRFIGEPDKTQAGAEVTISTLD